MDSSSSLFITCWRRQTSLEYLELLLEAQYVGLVVQSFGVLDWKVKCAGVPLPLLKTRRYLPS